MYGRAGGRYPQQIRCGYPLGAIIAPGMINPYIYARIYPYAPVYVRIYTYKSVYMEELEGGTPSKFAADILWGLQSPQVPYTPIYIYTYPHMDTVYILR